MFAARRPPLKLCVMRRAEKREPVCPVCRKMLIKGIVQRERAGGRIAVYEALDLSKRELLVHASASTLGR